MQRKNIFFSLFFLTHISSLFSMELTITVNKKVIKQKPLNDLYPSDLKNDSVIAKRRVAMRGKKAAQDNKKIMLLNNIDNKILKKSTPLESIKES